MHFAFRLLITGTSAVVLGLFIADLSTPHAEPPSFVPNCKVAHLASGPLGHLFQLRPVFAESCSMTPCSGHYLVLDIYDCCPAWGGFIPFYYSDPEASYSSGYYYTGGVNCPHCPSGGCTESGCQNP
jgi:hypothetical protein